MDMEQIRDELAFLDDHMNRVRPKLRATPAMVQLYLSWIEKGASRHVAVMHFENALFSGQPAVSSRMMFWGLSAIILVVAPLILALYDVVVRGLFWDGVAFYLVGTLFLVYGLLRTTKDEALRPIPLVLAAGLTVLLYFLYTEKIYRQGVGRIPSPSEAVHHAMAFATFLYGLLPLGMYVFRLYMDAREIDVVDSVKGYFRKRLGKDRR